MGRRLRARVAQIEITGLERLVVALWVVFLMDPQWWLRSFIGGIATRLPTPFFLLIGAAAFVRQARKGQWAPPLLAFLLVVGLTTPLSINIGRSFAIAKMAVILWLLAVGSLNIITSPRRAFTLVVILMLWQYLWWGLHGVKSGLVAWDYLNSNYDGYGPLMAGGIAGGTFLGLAVKKGKLKWLAFLTAGLSLVALMSSFARGAVLSGVAVIAVSWLRSPRKGAMTGGIVVGGLLVVLLASTVFSHIDRGDARPNFFQEMATIVGAVGDPSNDVEGTAQDREAIWMAARKLFQHHPLIGVGADCFGPAASDEFVPGELPGIYGEYPGALWSKALHNVYYQVLCELGLAGAAVLLWMLFDFFKKNSKLRSKPFREAWLATTGGQSELLYIALGLEAIMVGWLVCAYFYNVLFVPWFYGTLLANMILHSTLLPYVEGARARSAPRAPRVTRPRRPAAALVPAVSRAR